MPICFKQARHKQYSMNRNAHMTNQVIIIISLFFIYFHVSGLATTNILRLTAGSTTPVLTSNCYCDSCGATIPPLLQLPLISYIVCKGRCRSCGAQIPVFPLLLELTILSGMFVVTILMKCTFLAVSASFLFYEVVRFLTVVLLGRRAEEFVKQYLIAVLLMLPFYILTLFVALLYSLV